MTNALEANLLPLTAEERAKRRAERQAKKAAIRATAMEIRSSIDEGLSTDEIGNRLALPPHRVRRIAVRHAIALPRPHTKRLAVTVSAARAAMIRELADGAQVPASEMVQRLLSAMLADGIERARKRLGVDARPKRCGRPRALS